MHFVPMGIFFARFSLIPESVQGTLEAGATTDGQTSRSTYFVDLEIGRRQSSRRSFSADDA